MKAVIAEARLKRGSEETTLGELRKRHPHVVMQMVALRNIPEDWRVVMVAEQTARAMTHDSLLAERPEVDLLLRLAGTTQISEAISRVGYRRPGKKLLVAFGGPRTVSSLKRRLNNDDRFRIVESEGSGTADEAFVEAAALLAAKKA